jgi:hypothetical protein
MTNRADVQVGGKLSLNVIVAVAYNQNEYCDPDFDSWAQRQINTQLRHNSNDSALKCDCRHEQGFGMGQKKEEEGATVSHVRELGNFCCAATKITASGVFSPIQLLDLPLRHLPNAQRLVGYDRLLSVRAKIDMWLASGNCVTAIISEIPTNPGTLLAAARMLHAHTDQFLPPGMHLMLE